MDAFTKRLSLVLNAIDYDRTTRKGIDMKIAEQYELLMSQVKRDDLEFTKQCEYQCSHVYIATRHGTVEATNVFPSYKHKYFGEGRITRKRLQELVDYKNELNRTPDNLFIHYKYRGDGCGYSAAKCILEILNGEGYVFSCETQADEMSSDMVAKREANDKHRESGGSFCKYCGKIIEKGEEVSGVVIARQYPNMRGEFVYCSKTCNTHDQMAHEG